MDDGSRIRSARWVIGPARLYGAALVLAAAWSLVGVLFTGSRAPCTSRWRACCCTRTAGSG